MKQLPLVGSRLCDYALGGWLLVGLIILKGVKDLAEGLPTGVSVRELLTLELFAHVVALFSLQKERS